MASTKVWKVRYNVGTTGLIIDSPAKQRSGAMRDAETIAGNGWAVTVRHAVTDDVVYQSIPRHTGQAA